MRSTRRMRTLGTRTARVALVVTAVMTAGLATVAAAAPPKDVALAKWTHRVCAGIATWNAQLARVAPTTPSADPTAARSALSGSLQQTVIATDSLVRSLKAAGSPKVAHGRPIAAVFVSAFSDAGRELAGAASTAETLPTSDTESFNRGAIALETAIQRAITGVDNAFAGVQGKYSSKTLDGAFAHEPACQGLVAGTPPVTTTTLRP